MKTIIFGSPIFFSYNDEENFFKWINSIECIHQVKGIARELHLDVDTSSASDLDIREFVSVFKRYNIPLGNLAIFATDKREWFSDPSMSWYKEVFCKNDN